MQVNCAFLVRQGYTGRNYHNQPPPTELIISEERERRREREKERERKKEFTALALSLTCYCEKKKVTKCNILRILLDDAYASSLYTAERASAHDLVNPTDIHIDK